MQTYVVYLYQMIGKYTNPHIEENYFVLDSFPIAGLLNPRTSMQTGLKLRPFEIQQDNLHLLVKNADKLAIKILRIEFDDDIDPDLEDDLKIALNEIDQVRVAGCLELIRSQNIEIKSVTFLYKARQYRVTKYAVAEISALWEEVPMLTVSSPLAMVTGMKPFPVERLGEL
ncbi:hypothetical protein J31TS4_40560 [Paenibacillus sp. J31TS4]|uniref:hypothetical protein n=1 Tax=Paenibacillus sp. J31TS4 TaxID=2807195 RepID=UPI001B092CA8|nr:hypothetical protein [Paenibacillus sp. J31TS4]GIP40776.1 hypothetical protein J31TS4_40560 [Paenibacillus sp. J31TS4]